MWNPVMRATMNLEPYPEPLRRSRAIVAYTAVYLLGVLFTVYAVAVPFDVLERIAEPGGATYLYRALRPATFPGFTISMLAFYSLGGFTLWRLWQGRLESVILAPAVMVYLGAVSLAVINNIALAQNAYLLILPLLLAGLLDGDRGLLIFTPIHFAVLVLGYAIYIGREPINLFENLVLMVLVSVGIIALLYLYLRAARLTRSETEATLIQQRLQIAQLTTRITRSIADPEDLDEILNQIVHEIRDTFPRAYHVQVFLLNQSGRVAELVASTGQVGQALLANKHSLPVGSSSVVGYVTQQQQPYRTVVGADKTVHRPNPYLPDTRLELALPLNVGTRTIGALDLQSTDPEAFLPADLTTLQAIANAIAVTINNARLIRETNTRLRENQILVERMTATQREVERLNRELTGAIWADYLRGQQADFSVKLDFEEDQTEALTSDELSDAIQDAIDRDDIIRKSENGRQIVAIPVRVRGEVIGAMEFELEADLTGADMDLLQEVGERFGLAAENNRLYENSQRIAQREALVNQISTRIQSANSVDATVAEAARSLRDALKARRVAIRLGAPSGATPPQKNGSEE